MAIIYTGIHLDDTDLPEIRSDQNGYYAVVELGRSSVFIDSRAQYDALVTALARVADTKWRDA